LASQSHTLTIPSSTRYLEDVRQFVMKRARSADFSDSEIEQLKIAVDEACTNVIKHAYNGEGEHVIEIAVIVTRDNLTVRIRDRGRSFDPNSYTEPNLIEFAKSRRAGGLGVHIMNRLMDRVEYRSRGGVNECCLVKYRNPSD
jgi:serine/threonine-protein kinase RsbW